MNNIPQWNRPLRHWQNIAFAKISTAFSELSMRFTLVAFPGSGQKAYEVARLLERWLNESKMPPEISDRYKFIRGQDGRAD